MKVELELAIVKALDKAPLTIAELQELGALGVRDLMVDHELDYLLAEKILNHVKHEMLRLQAQNQQTPYEEFELDLMSLVHSDPQITKPMNLAETKLRRRVRRLARDELSRRRRQS